jgi:hypothetical protein
MVRKTFVFMKAGVIGLPEGDFGTIESLEKQISEDPELLQCIEVQRTQTTDSNLTVQKGRVAVQHLDERENVEIVDGNIRVQSQTQPVTQYTEFVAVPNRFVAVSSSSGLFAFNFLGGGTAIERANIDLDSYFETQQAEKDATPWKAGFYGHLGNAEKGVVYGDRVFDDSDIGGAVASSQKSQLGLSYSQGDGLMKINVTESGYVEVYQPSNYEESEFAEFVVENVLEHTSN